MKLPSMNLHGKHKPLASFVELCADLDVSQARLRGFMRRKDAPRPKLEHERGTYYEVKPFKLWFKGVVQ